MYSLFVFLHVLGALFLGSFLVLPFAIHNLYSRTGKELMASLHTILSFTRAGHYALIVLFLTGGGLVMGYSAFPSILWVVIAGLFLIVIGGLIGMIGKELKHIYFEEKPAERLLERMAKLKGYSWLTGLTIVAALFVMTNRQLFS